MYKYYYKYIPGVEKGFENQSYGRQLDSLKAIQYYKTTAISIWISCKRRSFNTALKEFKDLYRPTSYFVKYRIPDEFYSDDCVEVFYKKGD